MYPYIVIEQIDGGYAVRITTLTGEVIEKTTDSWAGVTALLKPKQATGTAVHFDTFWALYPSKVAKKTARDAWKRHNLDAKAQIVISGLERYLQSKKVMDGFIVNPTTFINQRRWEDEVEDVNNKVVAAPQKEPLHLQLLRAEKARNIIPIGDEPAVITMSDWVYVPKGYYGIEDGLKHKSTDEVYPLKNFRPL